MASISGEDGNCGQIDCVNPVDFPAIPSEPVFTYLNQAVSYDLGPCAGDWSFDNALPVWMTFDGDRTVTGSGGVFSSTVSQEDATAAAQAALDGWIEGEIAIGALTCEVVTIGFFENWPGPPVPTSTVSVPGDWPGWAEQLVSAATGIATQCRIFIERGTASGRSYTVGLWTDTGANLPSSLIASKTITEADLPVTAAETTFVYDIPVALTLGTKYWRGVIINGASGSGNLVLHGYVPGTPPIAALWNGAAWSFQSNTALVGGVDGHA